LTFDWFFGLLSIALLNRDTDSISADWLLGLTEARDYTRNYTKLSAPTSPPPPIEEKFNPETIALMQQIRNLESRIKALETQPTFACG